LVSSCMEPLLNIYWQKNILCLLLFTLGSTFKPLNPVKRLDKGKKRSRRTTIMGIPHQVQRELGTLPTCLKSSLMLSYQPQSKSFKLTAAAAGHMEKAAIMAGVFAL
uniref:Uncharacterized protein n=1 Tax=Myripristis murdjan TaxID=586833 RepID=A0A667XNL8_9TELE